MARRVRRGVHEETEREGPVLAGETEVRRVRMRVALRQKEGSALAGEGRRRRAALGGEDDLARLLGIRPDRGVELGDGRDAQRRGHAVGLVGPVPPHLDR